MKPHQPRKRFGQNFLTDLHYIHKIVATIAPDPSDHLIEIGPGLGALTAPLLTRAKKLDVIEIDRDLIRQLQQRFSPHELTVHAGDALKFDFSQLPGPLKIVGNLPYNISTPLLFHLSRFAENIATMCFMLQKEVVMRIAAAPGNSDYGRLSVMLQYRFQVQHLFDVPPGAFYPAPKVTSSILRLTPLADGCPRAKYEGLFADIVTSAFSQRRKTLRNTLKPFLTEADFAALDLDPGLRAERISVTDFIRIADHVAAIRISSTAPLTSFVR